MAHDHTTNTGLVGPGARGNGSGWGEGGVRQGTVRLATPPKDCPPTQTTLFRKGLQGNMHTGDLRGHNQIRGLQGHSRNKAYRPIGISRNMNQAHTQTSGGKSQKGATGDDHHMAHCYQIPDTPSRRTRKVAEINEKTRGHKGLRGRDA
jgi:hypothetical protein